MQTMRIEHQMRIMGCKFIMFINHKADIINFRTLLQDAQRTSDSFSIIIFFEYYDSFKSIGIYAKILMLDVDRVFF
jgi:hypothetical protein